ncbi:MAG: c-type cytochrome [Flavobacteriales bacterium]|nr:c-type cytochrome [Flavobacteriales bacterium]
MSMRFTLRTLLLALPLLALSCEKDPDPPSPPGGGGGGGNGAVYDPTPYALDIPANFPPMVIPPDNPITAKGVELGRFLFYEERLSGNNTQSCGSCHSPQAAFTDDGNQFSTGIDGAVGTRNTMALINLGWDNFYFWDGRAATLEQQVLEPVVNPIEMHETWPNAVVKLQADTAYQDLFIEAFDAEVIDSTLVARAIAQFLRTMISANSKLDKVLRGEAFFTQEEQRGVTLTQLEGGDPNLGQGGQNGADCFHCHSPGGWPVHQRPVENNGLDSVFTDLGAGAITGNPQDMGKFKVPTLRNVALSAPYMHDGRFQTLEQVVEHYNSGGVPSATISPFMKFTQGGLQLPPSDKQALIAFLHTLTDMDFVNDPRFQDPGPP